MTTVNGPRNLLAAQEIADDVRAAFAVFDQQEGAPYETVMGLMAQLSAKVALGQLYVGLAQTSAMAANIRRNGAVSGIADGWAEVLTGAEPQVAGAADGLRIGGAS